MGQWGRRGSWLISSQAAHSVKGCDRGMFIALSSRGVRRVWGMSGHETPQSPGRQGRGRLYFPSTGWRGNDQEGFTRTACAWPIGASLLSLNKVTDWRREEHWTLDNLTLARPSAWCTWCPSGEL